MFAVQGGWWVWPLAFAVVLLLLAVGSGTRRRKRRRPRPLDPADEQDVEQLFARVDAEVSREILLERLAYELDRLIARRTPLRTVRTAARQGLTRLGFADSTVLVARGARATDAAVLSMVLSEHPVVPISFMEEEQGLRLLLGWGSGTVQVLVVGSDQAD